ncbi:hypothetical protein [Sphingobium sp. RAC03]|uniref:hypothetical protein n=1 Tax=Sphingobium sp. RAC03 TaxID=1843368 RepID=UPI00083DD28F|nr:hypothetical protein [Sphingobium sp. RAC03]AOF98500.1 hypothetical protein BSY17_3964 [Sphingobium sp. RAC03]
MSNSYTKAAFAITVTDAEAVILRLVVQAVDIVADPNLTLSELESQFLTMGPDFAAIFPRTEDSPFDGLLDIFSDINHPSLDFDLDVGPSDGSGHVSLYLSGEQFDVETAARLLHRTARSALPFGFEYSFDHDKLRCGEFGGGYAALTEAGIEYGSTSDLLARSLARARDEGADGLVFAIRDAGHGLSFWNSEHGFGRLSLATVFSEAEAAAFDVPLTSDWSEWLAMPAPSRL